MTPKKKSSAKRTPKKTLAAIADKKTYYKVLLDGQSFHGGAFQWSLPKDGAPGDWHRIPDEQPIKLCETGFHVTERPETWYAFGAKVYEVEVDGVGDTEDDSAQPKTVVRSCRLLREISDHAELAKHQIFLSGTHTVKAGKAWALGESRVEAWGSSSVEAWGSSRVEAWGSSRVVARESSSVVAWGSSRVVARESSSVEAKENTTILVTWGDPKVQLDGFALLIDRRDTYGPPKVTGNHQGVRAEVA